MKYRQLTLLLFVLHLANALEDPSSYFGGSDNEEYIAWLQNVSYNKSTFVASTSDAGKGVAVHWTTDDAHIQLAVAVKATGWAGFGLGESGSMLGADIVMFTAETNQLVDSYVLDVAGMPSPDQCQSWTLLNSTVKTNFIVFEATRLLDTGDSQDRIFIDDSGTLIPPTRVLAAWGDSSEPSYHGNNTARGSIRFFGNTSSADELGAFAATMQAEAEGTFTIQANNFTIPANETTYQDFCFSQQDILAMNVPIDQDLHVIGIEPIVDPRAVPYVHHYLLYASSDPWNSSLSCDEYPAIEVAYVWAPGDPPLNLPSNVGEPLGPTGGFQSFSLQIHYNNPGLDKNISDSSGVRMYYTSKKRQFDLGIFQIGDPFVRLEGQSVSANRGLAQHNFGCSENCSSSYFLEPVTVIREHLHMHKTGVSATNAQIRNGKVVRQGTVQFWDFKQQGNLAVAQPPFDIQPGDSFRTLCDYDANNGQVFGLGSQQEMCIAFLYYYPRQMASTADFGPLPVMCGLGVGDLLPGCEVTYVETANFTQVSQLGRTFGSTPSTCPIDAPSSPASAPSKQGSPPTAISTSSSVAAYVSNAIPRLVAGAITTIAFL